MTTLFEMEAPKDVVMLAYPELGEELPVEAAAAAVVDTAAEEAAIMARVTAARAEGFEEAREEFEKRMHDGMEIERTAVTVACSSFAMARERYFGDVEGEVVKLALAIAARILHREVAMDPTLLAGVVRVALAKLSDAQGAMLCVAEEDVEIWQRAMKSSGLAVEADASLGAGEVQLKATGSVAELGIEAQLVEVERGFFDLLAKRPA